MQEIARDDFAPLLNSWGEVMYFVNLSTNESHFRAGQVWTLPPFLAKPEISMDGNKRAKKRRRLSDAEGVFGEKQDAIVASPTTSESKREEEKEEEAKAPSKTAKVAKSMSKEGETSKPVAVAEDKHIKHQVSEKSKPAAKEGPKPTATQEQAKHKLLVVQEQLKPKAPVALKPPKTVAPAKSVALPPKVPKPVSLPPKLPKPVAMAQETPKPVVIAQEPSKPVAVAQEPPKPVALPQELPKFVAMIQVPTNPAAMAQQPLQTNPVAMAQEPSYERPLLLPKQLSDSMLQGKRASQAAPTAPPPEVVKLVRAASHPTLASTPPLLPVNPGSNLKSFTLESAAPSNIVFESSRTTATTTFAAGGNGPASHFAQLYCTANGKTSCEAFSFDLPIRPFIFRGT